MDRIDLYSWNVPEIYILISFTCSKELEMATRYKIPMVMGTGHNTVSAEFELHKIYIKIFAGLIETIWR